MICHNFRTINLSWKIQTMVSFIQIPCPGRLRIPNE
jgi:hypothetical protein